MTRRPRVRVAHAVGASIVMRGAPFFHFGAGVFDRVPNCLASADFGVGRRTEEGGGNGALLLLRTRSPRSPPTDRDRRACRECSAARSRAPQPCGRRAGGCVQVLPRRTLRRPGSTCRSGCRWHCRHTVSSVPSDPSACCNAARSSRNTRPGQLTNWAIIPATSFESLRMIVMILLRKELDIFPSPITSALCHSTSVTCVLQHHTHAARGEAKEDTQCVDQGDRHEEDDLAQGAHGRSRTLRCRCRRNFAGSKPGFFCSGSPPRRGAAYRMQSPVEQHKKAPAVENLAWLPSRLTVGLI